MKLINKLLLLVVVSALVSITLISYLSFTFTRDSISEPIQATQLQMARLTIDKIDRALNERYNDVQSMAGDQTIEAYLTSIANKNALSPNPPIPDDMKRRVDELTIVTGPWDDIEIVSTDGTIAYSIDRESIGKNIKNETEHEAIFKEALKGKITYSDAAISSELQKPNIMFSVPIRNDSNPEKPIVGVLITHLSWQIVVEIVESVKGPIVDLYRSDGLVIANNDDPENIFKENNKADPTVKEALSGKEKSVNATNVDGIQTVSSFTTEKGFANYRGNKWFVIIDQPTDVAFAPAVQSAIKTTLIIVPVVLITSVFILILILRFVGPIQLLIKTTNEIAAGDLKQRVQINSKDEFGQLASSFNNMTTKLQQLYDGLEQKVLEKTRQLQEEKESVEKKVVERTKQLADEQGRLQASINSLSIGYVMSGPDHSLILINSAAEKIMTLDVPSARPVQNAIDVSNLKGKIDITFIHNALIGSVNLWQQLEEAQKTRKSIFLKDIPYKMLFLNLYIAPIVNKLDDELIGTVLLIEDMTEQKVLERSRDEFFSIASHELRTPLTAIRGNAALITDYFSKEITNPDVLEIISDIHESSLRLIDIVNDFLDLSRLEQGKIQYVSEPFELVKLCEEVLKEYDVTGSRKKLALEIDKTNTPIPLVYADKSRFRQIIVNLVSNGIKFTQQGGIKISFAPQEHSIKLFITDTGSGIPESNQKLLFRKFQQAESNILTRDSTKGTGLGLYISKLMITNMGGTIALERSEEGKGSTFGVTVPIATDTQKSDYEQKLKQQSVNTDQKGGQHV